jgi:lambda family phage portal protein
MKPNFLDNLIGFFSPRSKLERLQVRAAADVLKRGYDAAQVDASSDWISAKKTSANAEISAGLSKLQEKSHDLARNNPYFVRALNVIVSNTVGAGIIGKIKGRNKTQEKKLSELWNQVTESSLCDVEGRNNFYFLQALAMRTIVESGELVALKVIDTESPKIKLLESEFIANVKDQSPYVQGVKLDSNGKPVAFVIYKRHPGDGSTLPSDTVEISSESVIHAYKQDRPGQVRGTPWSHAVIENLKDFADWQTATLIRQKVAACWGGFITTNNASGLSASDLKERRENELTMSPSTFRYLGDGESVTMANPPGVDGYSEYVRETMRAVSAGMGISYEAMTGDYSQVNFSSGRMGHIEFRRNIDNWRWNLLIPQLCEPFFKMFLQWAKLRGIDIEGARIEWVPPAHVMIDPTKEINAEKEAVRAGFKSRSRVILESGNDPETTLQEIKKEREAALAAGLSFDTDAPVAKPINESDNDSEEDDKKKSTKAST